MRWEETSSRFGASQLKSERQPQCPARSIYLIFACERAAALLGSNCIFNLSGLKEKGNLPLPLRLLNKPISRTLLFKLNGETSRYRMFGF